MKIAVKICKSLIVLLGAFIILMASDSFDGTDSIWNMILEYLMNSLPGIVLIAVTFSLWKHEFILGIILIAAGIGLFFLFKLYRDFDEKWITFLIVEIPLLGSGMLLLLNHRKKTIL